ncbi:hypothetical protein KEM54_006622 [Ascosphaera aggregata]|nr:hypothetical protein KEM54_006622 [Ascosphaera aggregata]
MSTEAEQEQNSLTELNEPVTASDPSVLGVPSAVPTSQGSGQLSNNQGHTSGRSSDSSPERGNVPSGSVKGQLSVQISQGRGLVPSYDPYIVCVFELNEYISGGTQEDEALSSPDGISIQQSATNNAAGRPVPIPSKGRTKEQKRLTQITDPQWNHDATFDVLNEESNIDFSVYDSYDHDKFLGHVRLRLSFKDDSLSTEGWFALKAWNRRGGDNISGEIHLRMTFQRSEKKVFGPNDFQLLSLVGKGTFGQVYQVMKKDTKRIYAMKVLSKKVIIQKKEVQHTIGERNILVRSAQTNSPFIVGLKFSFQTPTDLYLVTDYMSGGELFWHLQKEGRFEEPRAKFYIAELILALKHLHDHDIVYRDLKPENILLDANGHIALCDFGLSKANLASDDTTNTFCGTTEYLAPEILLDDQGYTKMVDFWSLGVLVFEMCCGWSPFYAEDTQQMYKNIAFGKVRFPRDALSIDGRNFVKGLLNRNPKHRMGATNDALELMAHPFFNDIDWEALEQKNVPPPFKPKLTSEMDTSYFDPEFTTAMDQAKSLNARAAMGAMPASTPLSPGMQANFKGFTFVDESSMEQRARYNANEHFEDAPSDDVGVHSPHSNDNYDDEYHDNFGDDWVRRAPPTDGRVPDGEVFANYEV